MLDAALDAVIWVDEHARIVGANAAALTLLGWQSGQELAEPLRGEVVGMITNPESTPLRIEREVTGLGGTSLHVEASITFTEFDGARIATLFLRDLTTAKRAERRREVEHRLARVLAAAGSGEDIARGTLEMVATALEFDHGELWLADHNGASLRLVAAWRRQPGGPFGDAARQMIVRRGEDLAGLAWASGEPLFIDDAQAVEGLSRAEAIAAEGIRGVGLVPVELSGRITGVGVFARCGDGPLDPGLRDTLHAIGVQVRHFAERRRAERRLAEETVALAGVARATRELTGAVDIQAARQAIATAALDAAGATLAFLVLPDHETGALWVAAVAPADAPGPPLERRYEPGVPGAVMQAFESKAPVFLSEIPAASGADAERAKATGIASGLAQPVLHEDEAIGVIVVAWATRQLTLDRSTRLLLRLLAGEAAMAITRADLVAQLEAAARTDPLTGLANVRGWEENVVRELAAAARDGRAVAVAVLDLDGFKALNDRVGHQGGDRVLRASSAAWQQQLRQGDLLARLGGDEFAALLPGCQRDDALILAERLRTATSEITASIGVAYWNGEEPYAELMLRADDALYAAKAAGRDRVSSA